MGLPAAYSVLDAEAAEYQILAGVRVEGFKVDCGGQGCVDGRPKVSESWEEFEDTDSQ